MITEQSGVNKENLNLLPEIAIILHIAVRSYFTFGVKGSSEYFKKQ